MTLLDGRPGQLRTIRTTGAGLFVELETGITAFTAAGIRAEQALRARLSDVGRGHGTIVLRMPPVVPQHVLEEADYLATFPHLLGTVRGFTGGRREHRALLRAAGEGADWGKDLDGTGLVLTPTACHMVYELLRGQEVDGVEVEASATCFRREPSAEQTRFQSFAMVEFVHVGTTESAARFVDEWIERATSLVRGLGLTPRTAPAQDAFFGAAATLMGAGQSDPSDPSKTELIVDVDGLDVAVASVNRHGTKFGKAFTISSNGETAASACAAFGIERLLLACADAGAPWLRAATEGS